MLKMKFLGDYSIDDLKRSVPATFNEAICALSDYRDKFKILIIDDQRVAIASALKSLGYFVCEEQDVKTPEEAAKYDLILCDKMGVGKFLKSNSEGVFLARKIKEKYPFKPVILYSSSRLTFNDVSALKELDDVISEAPETDTFCDYVDGHIKKLMDPVALWMKLHLELVKKGLSSYDIAKIESDYVQQILKSNGYKFLPQRMTSAVLTVAKDLLVSFASQGIFSLFAR